jgi:carbamoyltransferase
MYLKDPTAAHPLDVVELLREQWRERLGASVPRDRIHFVRHHMAHAVNTFEMSGFERALVVTLDGQGETESGLVLSATPHSLELLSSVPIPNSLGHFFWHAIGFLGFRLFDEYKVMGLAPYGDPARLRSHFEPMYELLPEGRWELRPQLLETLHDVLKPRRKGEPIEQIHKDFAASLQELLERTVFHLLRHFQSVTGHRRLCLGGGVAHNCTMNGNILRSGLFDEVFVHPASHDAGNALGAALSVHREVTGKPHRRRLRSVYWGTDIGGSSDVAPRLEPWSEFLEMRRSAAIEEETAELIAAGKVIGWVQGRSEFGPRALGNRSILADPRPAEHKNLINMMVKKREAFRPFAPAVLAEDAADYFELPGDQREFPFMTFVLKVQPDKRALLGAVTHIDGSARVQTVSREDNPRFWALIRAFKARTGVPVLLNTSFNNNVEPIVDSVDDAVVCFLTTGIDVLVVGDQIATKKPGCRNSALVPLLPNHVRLLQTRQQTPGGTIRDTFELRRALWDGEARKPLSAEVFGLLRGADGGTSIAELARAADLRESAVLPALEELWAERCVVLRPAATSS